MNIVLSAFIIILLLYPGIFFRNIYFRGRQLDGVYKLRINILRQPIWEQVVASLGPALLIHFIGTQLITLLGFGIDYAFLYAFLKSDSLPPTVNLDTYFLFFCGYFTFTMGIGLLLGTWARSYVFNRRLDTKITLLRFSNEWFYWLTGRILESDEAHKDRSIDLIAVHALAETKENTIVYDGFLYDYTLTETTNGLDRIVLFYASKSIYRKSVGSRKAVAKTDEHSSEEMLEQFEHYERLEKREIQQEYLIIPYSQIKNLTITYIDLSDATDSVS